MVAPSLRSLTVALSLGLALAASLWLWARYGMGVYVDSLVSTLAGCL